MADKNKYHGFYRARVIEVDIKEDGEKNKYGAVRVYLPDALVKEVNDKIDEFDNGILAYPANGLTGGYNTEDKSKSSQFYGSVMVPPLGSYVWIFFEGGVLDYPFYFSCFSAKLHPIIPENRGVFEPSKVFTLFKSGDGRAIVICDSPDQQRVEITGKKRKLKESPVGDKQSVYEIDGNQTTILLDERVGKEKLLIRTHKGDYINIDIENQELEAYFKNSIKIKTDGMFSLQAAKGINITTDAGFFLTTKSSINFVTESMFSILSSALLSIRSKAIIGIDGIRTKIQTGAAGTASNATPEEPEGKR